MTMKTLQTAPFDLIPHGEDTHPVFEAVNDARFSVTVIHTTHEGTIAALRSATQLAVGLHARIVLQVAEAVPIHFPLHRPHVPADFLETRMLELICEAGVLDQDIPLHVWLCRNCKLFLAEILDPNSLVVIGADQRWWKARDRRLARWLTAQHHRVIVVPPESRVAPDPNLHHGRQAEYLRSLGFAATLFRNR